MRIEELSVENLKEGVFCAQGKPHADEMYDQLGAWLDGGKLRGLVARDDNGEPAGFVIYYPIENAPMDVEGEGLYVVQCLLVKPEHRNQGIGRALIEGALDDARESGASGLTVEGYKHGHPKNPAYLPGMFFEHMGLVPGESRGHGTLYYVGLRDDASAPHYLTPHLQRQKEEAAIRIDILDCRRCYTSVSRRKVVEAVAEQLGPDRVKVHLHDTTRRQAILDKGMSSGVFIDGKLTFFQGPVSEEDVLNALEVALSARGRKTDR